MAVDSKNAKELHSTLTLLMLVHLAIASDAEEELAKFKMARTHHRILYLVTHNPGVTVGKVVEILRVSSQAVQGPMRDLLNGGYIEQRSASTDKRKRNLHATAKGEKLLYTISAKQFARIAKAFERSTPTAAQNFRMVLSRLADSDDLVWAYKIEEADRIEAMRESG